VEEIVRNQRLPVRPGSSRRPKARRRLRRPRLGLSGRERPIAPEAAAEWPSAGYANPATL